MAGRAASSQIPSDAVARREDEARNLHPAQNIVPIVRREIVDAYGDDFTGLVNSISAAITTAELSDLNKRFGIDAEDAVDLATEWLEEKGFLE